MNHFLHLLIAQYTLASVYLGLLNLHFPVQRSRSNAYPALKYKMNRIGRICVDAL